MTELSIDYLKAFHKFVTGHQLIFDQVKAEIHKRARGSAGGTAKAKRALEGGGEEIDIEDISEHLEEEMPVKVTNAAHVEGDIIETEEYYDIPTVFAKEGVWTGTNGIPTLKTYEALKASAPWFVGTPITPQHIDTDTIRPTDRRLGHVISANGRDDKRDVFGISRLYKSLLTPDENKKVANRQNLDGSPGYFVPVSNETGTFDNKQYQAKEIGPYVLGEYAMFFDGTRGACDSASGCGPFQNARGKKKDHVDEMLEAPSGLILVDGRIQKRDDCPKKKKNEADQMTEEIETLKSEFTKQLNAANETIGNLTKTVSELTKKMGDVESGHKILNESFQNKQTSEAAAKEAANKSEFKKSLNAAAATEADALWDQIKSMNPVEYEGWKVTNSAKLLDPKEAKDTQGKKNLNAANNAARSTYLEAHNKR